MKSLVSIIVITYNSARYVLETLESAKEQTYDNIELIISDDCSTDDTLEVCRKWIDENRIRFIRTELITIDKNTGISANCNRGVKAANGEWVKLIAGDDILLNNCIEKLYTTASLNRTRILTCGILAFSENHEHRLIYPNKDKLAGNSKHQFRNLLKYGNFIYGCSTFMHLETLRELNGFDERFPMLEDYPLFIKYTKNGYRIGFDEEILIKYRVHKQSTINKKNEAFNNSRYDFYVTVLTKLCFKNFMYKSSLYYYLVFLKRKNNSKFPFINNLVKSLSL